MKKDRTIISHIKEDLSSIQTNAEHSEGVAALAKTFAVFRYKYYLSE